MADVCGNSWWPDRRTVRSGEDSARDEAEPGDRLMATGATVREFKAAHWRGSFDDAIFGLEQKRR